MGGWLLKYGGVNMVFYMCLGFVVVWFIIVVNMKVLLCKV